MCSVLKRIQRIGMIVGATFAMGMVVAAAPIEDQATITAIQVKEDYDLVRNLYETVIINHAHIEQLQGDQFEERRGITLDYLLALKPSIDYSLECVKTEEAEQVLMYLRHMINQMKYKEYNMTSYNEKLKNEMFENSKYWYIEMLNKNGQIEEVMNLIKKDFSK